MPDLECRFSKLEQRVEIMQDSHQEIADKLDRLLEQQQRQRGFIAGVSVTITVIASSLAWVFNHGFKIN